MLYLANISFCHPTKKVPLVRLKAVVGCYAKQAYRSMRMLMPLSNMSGKNKATTSSWLVYKGCNRWKKVSLALSEGSKIAPPLLQVSCVRKLQK